VALFLTSFVDILYSSLSNKADRPLMRDTLNAPSLLTNRQFQWTGNGHSQLPFAEQTES